jgi:hypothetical protein
MSARPTTDFTKSPRLRTALWQEGLITQETCRLTTNLSRANRRVITTGTEIGRTRMTTNRQGECAYRRVHSRRRFNVGQVLVLNDPPVAGGSLRTCTRSEIGRARMTYLQGECSHRRADLRRPFNVGRVLVLDTPLQECWHVISLWRFVVLLELLDLRVLGSQQPPSPARSWAPYPNTLQQSQPLVPSDCLLIVYRCTFRPLWLFTHSVPVYVPSPLTVCS